MELFKPIWMTWDRDKQEKAKRAVGKVKSEDKLFEIATTAPLCDVRLCAIDRITDQQLLCQIVKALKGSGLSVDENELLYKKARYKAISSISDPILLEKMAVDRELSKDDREKILRRIEDEDVLVKIALEADYYDAFVINCLHSQNAFAQVALNASDNYIRRKAISHLTDQETLRMIARDEKNEEVRIAAIGRLEDPDLLAEYADIIAAYKGQFDDDVYVAVSRITDAMALIIIASGTPFDRVRSLCVERLNTPGLCEDNCLNADKAAEAILNYNDYRFRIAVSEWLDAAGISLRDARACEAIRHAKLVEAANKGRMEELKADPEASLIALAGEFQKFIDNYVNKHVGVYCPSDRIDNSGFQELHKVFDYYERIARRIKFLHDNTSVTKQVEERFPKRNYTCVYEWDEYGVDDCEAIKCENSMTIAVW